MLLVSQPATGDNLCNNEILYEFLAGHYILIGKEMESDITYSGTVDFTYENGRLFVTREVAGKIAKGVGKMEPALGPDKVNVLRIRFSQAGQDYEITYLWQSDLDNYARLSGYLYQPGKSTNSPGMEVLFADHSR
jgi:hypothetical protein